MKFDEKLLNEIKESKAERKLIIVPAQLTLSAEKALFDGFSAQGFFDIHVMSGNKLRGEILSKTGGPGRTPINTLGRSMILRKCAKENELEVYGDLVTSPDFLASVGDFIVQAKQNKFDGNIPEGLSENLNRKLNDMKKISQSYEGYMAGKYIDSEDGLSFATGKVKDCSFIKSSELWFIGFYAFTKNEKEFLKALDEESLGCHVILDSPKEEFPKTLQGVYSFDNPYEEAINIASEILRLIREEGYEAEDIAILSGNISEDGPMYKRVFSSLNIPLYLDEKRSLMHLSSAGKIGSLLDILADGLYPSNVSAFIGDPDFTNYVKSYHIKGKAFLESFKYGGEKKIAAEIKRDEFANLFGPFSEGFNRAVTVREKSKALYDFMINGLKLPDEIKASAMAMAEDGYIDSSEEVLQAWPVIIGILDQAVELLGDEPISNEEYRDMIKNAFKDVKIGILPQESGCVSLGDIYRTKLSNVKALFVTSFKDGSIPRNSNSSGILTDDEIEKLEKAGLTLCKSAGQLLREDKIALFEAFEGPSEKLYITYANSDLEGKTTKPSYLLSNLPLSQMEGKIYTLEELTKKLRDFKSGGDELDLKWQAAAKSFANTERYEAAVKGLLHRGGEESLSKKTKDQILRTDSASPSALEKYARCPFAYFVSYGLKADENFDFSIQPKDIGDIHHEVLNRLSRHLSSDNKSARDGDSLWQKITDEEIKDFVYKAIDQIKEEDGTGLLTKGPQEEYETNKVKEVALRFAINMVKQLRMGNVDQVESERNFEFFFGGMKIYGKIDRLDTTKLSDKELVKVVDYKSGKAKFNPDLIRKGLSLQLMLYLESATSLGAKAVGSFYFHISDEAAKADILGEVSDKMTQKIAESYRLDGNFVEDIDCFMSLDKTVALGEKSLVVNKNKAMAEAEYEQLRAEFRKSLTESINQLRAGNVSVKPKKLSSDMSSCTYCKYKSICKFDPQIEGYEMG